MPPKRIFYSWQSNSDPQFNRNFIGDSLKRAIKKLNREGLSELVIDRDTKNTPGMPDIGNTIFEKIAKSHVVVADLTLINPIAVRRPDEEPVPNPNVLFELGYAFGTLGASAMIGVFNSISGKIEELPFDLRPKRMLTYSLDGTSDKAEVRTELVESLAAAIRQCLGDTEEERSDRLSRIYQILSDLWVFGTEIEEWSGIANVSEAIKRQLDFVKELPDLMRKNSFPQAALGRANYIIESLERASMIVLNDINWPKIKQHVSSAMSTVSLITWFHKASIHPDFHDQMVNSVQRMPEELDGHINGLESDGKVGWKALDNLSYSLRTFAFHELMPQHPQYAEGLKAITLEFRQLVLQWTKTDPKQDDAISALKDIRDRLSELVTRYHQSSSSPS